MYSLRQNVVRASQVRLRPNVRFQSQITEARQEIPLSNPSLTPTTKKKKKTVIAFKSLPQSVSNGASLPPWDGGLGFRHAVTDINGRNGELSAPTDIKVKKRRSKKLLSDEDSKTKPDTSTSRVNSALASTTRNEKQRVPRNQLALEILENLKQFPDCILLTRVGQFYESYFDQAQEVARLLSIKLAKRTWSGERVWMCGFPIMHLDKYLKVLVQQHKKSVALCEEFRKFEEGASAISKPTFERRVVRVLTPGTLIDESFLNPFENNFLLAVSSSKQLEKSSLDLKESFGLAWIDVSTGEFFSREVTADTLKDHFARINPQEIVVDGSEKQTSQEVLGAIQEIGCTVSYATSDDFAADASYHDSVPEDTVAGEKYSTQSPFTLSERSAIGLLNNFLKSHMLDHAPRTLRPLREEKSTKMQIDFHTLRALEIQEGLREGGVIGSLMSTVRRTVTSSGTRLLSRWLSSPSTSLTEIKARQSLVEFFWARRTLLTDLRELLREAEDASRVLQKFLLGRGTIDDLISIRNTIETWNAAHCLLVSEREIEARRDACLKAEHWLGMDLLLKRLVSLYSLSERISMAVDCEGRDRNGNIDDELGDVEDSDSPMSHQLDDQSTKPMTTFGLETKWNIKPQFSQEIAFLHDRLNRLVAQKDLLESEWRKTFSAPSLTLRHNSTHGLHVHVAKPRRDATQLESSNDFTRVSESKTTKVYVHQEWLTLGNSILETIISIDKAEKEAFLMLRKEVTSEATAIRRNARIFDELDVTSAFATLAAEKNFVRPDISESLNLQIANGRHPTVESGLLLKGRIFTANTLDMSSNSRLHIITGPNMGGKSTFLRQTALIVILAQTGSFVPADSAHIGIVDKVLSRVGAKDDLFRDRSTFMVEMLESADILNNATERSLVIMDEVGRGTTVTDGLAIAFSAVHHLHHTNECRTLFATHFHEVVDMLGYDIKTKSSPFFPSIDFFCTRLNESPDGTFVYDHRMTPGVNRDSHGIKVARLAGLPPRAISVAQQALIHIEEVRKSQATTKDSYMSLALLDKI